LRNLGTISDAVASEPTWRNSLLLITMTIILDFRLTIADL